MRGAIFRDGKFYIWDGHIASHDNMTTLGSIEHRLVFYSSLDELEMDCDWGHGSIWQNDTVFFVCTYINQNEMNEYPALHGSRCIGTFAGKGSDMPTGVHLRHDYYPDE